MIEEIYRSARQGLDFSFESTLSGMTHRNVIRDIRRLGYSAHLFFLWLPDEDLALSRIRSRVAGGGHDVAADIVRRRFGRSLKNFFIYRELVDSWMLIDNSGPEPTVIASQQHQTLRIINQTTYDRLRLQFEAES